VLAGTENPNLRRFVRNDWLPPGKCGAVCFSIDDIHPAKSTDYYEAGGDLERGALGHLQWLLERRHKLHATLFVTADWREISALPTRRLLAKIPFVRDHVYLAKRWPPGTMRLDYHPEFVSHLKSLPRTEIGLHGLHHCHKGPRIPVEFQDQTRAELTNILKQVREIFKRAGISPVPGISPPGWNAPPALFDAMVDTGLTFLASARDTYTPITPDALACASGIQGVPLIYPQLIHADRLVSFSSNFHATSPIDRATAIIENGGLLAIKAHIVKNALGYVSNDGLDTTYRNYLDVVLTILEDRYGDSLWWTSMGEIAESIFKTFTVR
jgi:hypothetical protein